MSKVKSAKKKINTKNRVYARKKGKPFEEVMKNVSTFYVFLYVLLMAVFFPFFLTRGYMNAGTDKAMLYRYIGEGLLISVLPCAVIYWLIRIGKEGWQKCLRSVSSSDWLVLAFLLVNVVSYFCSENRAEAFWGTRGWYIGLMTQIFYLCSYIFISRFFKGEKVLVPLFALSTAIIYILGILNRFSVYPIKMEGAATNFISTLGNINWFCGFWSVFFPIAVGLFYKSKGKKASYRIAVGVYLALATAAGAIQGSDSALLVFGSVVLVLFFLSADLVKRQSFYETVMVLCATCQIIRFVRKIKGDAFNYDSGAAELLTNNSALLIIGLIALAIWVLLKILEKKQVFLARFFLFEKWVVFALVVLFLCVFVALIVCNTKNPGSIGALSENKAFTFNAYWGSSRGITWTAGLTVFGDQSFLHRLIGIGPDSFVYGVYKEGSSATQMVRDVFGNSRLTNAHNEWITVLVNNGILGLLSFAGFFVLKIRSFLKAKVVSPLVFACGLALVGYTFHNIFSFQQTLNGPFIYIAMGVGEAMLRREEVENK